MAHLHEWKERMMQKGDKHIHNHLSKHKALRP